MSKSCSTSEEINVEILPPLIPKHFSASAFSFVFKIWNSSVMRMLDVDSHKNFIAVHIRIKGKWI